MKRKYILHLTVRMNQYRNFVKLRDLSQRTANTYISHVRMLGDHFNTDPQYLAEEQVRDYFLFLRQVKDYQASTMNQTEGSGKKYLSQLP